MNRVLIVHRDRQTLDGLEKLLLNRADHQVTLADTVDVALGELAHSSPGLVLLCLPLKNTSGRDAVAAFHSIEPKIPVVVLSSRGGTDETITNRVVRQTIAEALRHTDGNRSRAARLLGVSQPTLLAKMRKQGLR